MASLQNEQIDQSYQGLIKTANNLGAAPFPPAKLQYGNGTELPISIGDGTSIGIGDIVTIQSGTRNIDLNSNNLAINGLTNLDALGGTASVVNGTFNFGLGFPGAPATNVDFTNATVTGLPAGANTTYDLTSAQDGANVDITLTGSDATTDTVQLTAGTGITLTDNAAGSITIDAAGGGSAGLVSGTGADSMKSDDSLTTGGTLARGVDDIVLGDGANSKTDASFGANIVIGTGASQTGGERNIVLGRNSVVTGSTTIVIGDTVVDGGSNQSVIIGSGASTNTSDEQIVIGFGARGEANAGGICIGRDVDNGGLNAISIGRQADSSNNAISAGYQAIASGNESAAFGYSADATAGSSVALGDRALANLTESVAIGSQVTSLWASGTTVNQFAIANYANINYADDTAAAAGGVPLGGVYHTSGALKIRIA